MALRTLGFLAPLCAIALAVAPLPAAIAAAQGDAPSLTEADCRALAEAETATDLRDRLDELGIVPEERRISSLLNEMQWMEGLAFLSVTLNGDRVDRITCQSGLISDTTTPTGEPHVLCERIEMDMDLAQVQQALGSNGEQIVGEDGLPVGLAWQWADRETGQVAIVAFNNFGEMAGRSCITPPPPVETQPDVEPGAEPGSEPGDAVEAIEAESF
ncbi:MAG: hypothetical protein ACFB9N_10160 [Geitlerinemataceae cyanobacterium]